jgi:hypothetical protein
MECDALQSGKCIKNVSAGTAAFIFRVDFHMKFDILAAVNIKSTAFGRRLPIVSLIGTDVSEEPAASIFRVATQSTLTERNCT